MTIAAHPAWEVRFDADSATLAAAHAAAGAAVEGALSFRAGGDGGMEPWTIGGEDNAGRLGLVDPKGNIQGYLVFRASPDCLEVAAVHRAAQSYRGVLAFDGTASLGERAFACRTVAPRAQRVVQMASGPAQSALNDSLFDEATDTVLAMSADSVRIASPPEGSAGRSFTVSLRARPEEAAAAVLSFRIVSGYYRGRWAPHFRPRHLPRRKPATGWMSWNVYFDQAGEEENLAEARIAAEKLRPFGLDTWSIESWQAASDRLPVSGFHNLTLEPHPRQFPHGMKWLADRIRELGFVPGIWTVPFGTGSREFYEAHRDWFLHDKAGNPLSNWCGRYVLDPTLPEVREHMRETHRTMSADWGYEFFKVDGMSGRGPHYSAHFYEREEVRAAFRTPCDDPFRLCVEALREGMGQDRYFLACQGHFTGPEAAYADAARIGGDIVSPDQPPRWHNLLSQASATLAQLFVHGIVWQNDPDTILVGSFHPLEAARVATTIVALPGQLTFLGDRLAELDEERVRLLRQALPVCDVRPLDLYPIFELAPVWVLKVSRSFGSWDVVSLFNWRDEEAEVGFTFAEIGLPPEGAYLLFDFWRRELVGELAGGYAARLAPRSNALLSVHPALGRPQLLSTDRHVTQGATSLGSLRWDDEARTLEGSTELVAGHESVLSVHVPEGFRFAAAESRGACSEGSAARHGRMLELCLRGERAGVAEWRLRFR